MTENVIPLHQCTAECTRLIKSQSLLIDSQDEMISSMQALLDARDKVIDVALPHALLVVPK